MNWCYLGVCILFLALLATTIAQDEDDDVVVDIEIDEGLRLRHRHRHRHRFFLHRHLKTDMNYVEMLKEFEEGLNTLTDGLSIKEDVMDLVDHNITFPKAGDLVANLRSPQNLLTDIPDEERENLEIEVLDSIVRTLNFYNSQLGEIKKGDAALSLKILNDIDDKHGQSLKKDISFDQWIQKSCDAGKMLDASEETFCKSMIRQWKSRSGGKNTANMEYWKPAIVLQKYLNQIDSLTIDSIGAEKEGLWGKLNGECQEAVVSRCEIPYVCERTLLDPTPRSQYLLTHQILQRLLIDNANCPNLLSFVSDEKMYEKLCTKAYLEAQYLDLLHVPINQRDLFAELVGFCGYLGYTNFFRVDWLQRILSWQSQSESGCFVEDPQTPVGLITTDMGFKRKATTKELAAGIEQPNENCLPHLTAVALTAVTAYWDYLMDLRHQVRLGDRLEL